MSKQNGSKVTHTSKNFFKINKLPILVTIIFFLFTSYVSFFIDNPARGSDAMYYFFAGEQILFGDYENVKVPNAPIGGPVLFSSLNTIFHDPYLTIKIISIISGTGIVFLAFFITKNIFNFKIAFLTQLIVAVNPKLHFQTAFPFNEIFPVFLVFLSFYYFTKTHILYNHLILAGILLGISFMFRYQTFPVVIGFLIYLLIRNKKLRKNLPLALLFVGSFLVGCSPLLIYNYTTFGNLIDSDPNYYMHTTSAFIQTEEWEKQVHIQGESFFSGITSDFNIFLENYLFNLFYHNPDRIFNLSGGIDNISPIPAVPYVGIILIFGGVIYYLKPNYSKKLILSLILSTISTTIIISLLGILETYFFAIIIIPMLILGIFSFKKIQKNFLPLFIIAITYFMMMAIIPVGRAENFFSIWIVFPILASLFFLGLIPELTIRKNESKQISLKYSSSVKTIIIISIILLLSVNLAFSYKFMNMIEYGDKSFDGIIGEVEKIFGDKKHGLHLGTEIQRIGEILSQQDDIENSYVMGNNWVFVYYCNCKLLFADFVEGDGKESLQSYITRENWSEHEIFISNILSIPLDRNSVYKPVPDYLIYHPTVLIESPENLKILENPNHPKVKSYLELLYKSKLGTLVYKINHGPN
jgi:4-amino-4-deoxy-L-arabinose transferase-like glycosyltransferase